MNSGYGKIIANLLTQSSLYQNNFHNKSIFTITITKTLTKLISSYKSINATMNNQKNKVIFVSPKKWLSLSPKMVIRNLMFLLLVFNKSKEKKLLLKIISLLKLKQVNSLSETFKIYHKSKLPSKKLSKLEALPNPKYKNALKSN